MHRDQQGKPCPRGVPSAGRAGVCRSVECGRGCGQGRAIPQPSLRPAAGLDEAAGECPGSRPLLGNDGRPFAALTGQKKDSLGIWSAEILPLDVLTRFREAGEVTE